MGFSQALSGLNSASTNLDTIGNNIANSQTVGFKASSVQFADVFAGAKTGLGTKVAAVLQNFSNGTLENTGRNMDLAIDGGGFFRLVQNEQVVFSRNGQFTVDNEGYMVNAQGARLTGFEPGVESGGNPVELQVPAGALAAKASENVEATLNLDAGADPITAAFDQTDPDTYSYANNVTLFDSQGNAHNTTMYFTKLTGPNEWGLQMSLGGTVVGGTNLQFNTNGELTGGGTQTFNFGAPAGFDVEPVEIELNLGNDTTQFGKDFEFSKISQDGYASGSLVGVAIGESGEIIGSYSNEQSQTLGTIAMVDFANAEGLKSVGDNVWAETMSSGQAITGMAGSGQFGGIRAGVVENSNVDLTQELVNMIIAQRSYQANAQTIKVQDEVLQSAVNL